MFRDGGQRVHDGSGKLENHCAVSGGGRVDTITSFGYINTQTAPLFAADVDGDGRSDVCFVTGVNGGTTGSGKMELHCALGAGGRVDTITAFDYINTQSALLFPADVNGDGRSDVCFVTGVNGFTTGSGKLRITARSVVVAGWTRSRRSATSTPAKALSSPLCPGCFQARRAVVVAAADRAAEAADHRARPTRCQQIRRPRRLFRSARPVLVQSRERRFTTQRPHSVSLHSPARRSPHACSGADSTATGALQPREDHARASRAATRSPRVTSQSARAGSKHRVGYRVSLRLHALSQTSR